MAENLKIIGLSAENNLQNLDPAENNAVSKKCKGNPKTKNLVFVSDSQFSCNMCTKQYTNRGTLWQHKISAHEFVRYPCDQCKTQSFGQRTLLLMILKMRNIMVLEIHFKILTEMKILLDITLSMFL